MNSVKLTIDGQSVIADKDDSILEAAGKIGIEIPALCTDPNLEIVASCRLCLVEIEGMPAAQTACSTKVREGMKVITVSPKIKKMRKNILELLLYVHPNDCLTCEKAGRCLLQKYAYEYGATFKEHNGRKRDFEKDLSSPYIIKDDNKCILCSKCVRVCNQIKERSVLTFSNRGYNTKVALNWGKDFDKSSCVSCNRCVSVCPVGALMDRRSYGKVRSWYSERETVKCRVCEQGCKFDLIKKDGKVVSVEANKPDGGRPLCLKGRMTTEFMYVDKPEKPYKKDENGFEETSWKDILELEPLMDKLEKLDKE